MKHLILSALLTFSISVFAKDKPDAPEKPKCPVCKVETVQNSLVK